MCKFSIISSSLRVCWNFLCSLVDSLDESKVGTFGTTRSVGAESENSKAKARKNLKILGLQYLGQ